MLPLALYWGSYTVARQITVGSEGRVASTLHGWGMNLAPLAWLRGRPQTP
ncbi:MAG: hypothetical protein NTZ54_11185 [Alphaproteobacteria bacterium]|nr:hypothetical protein [Alphaproteobacteria bacterium]